MTLPPLTIASYNIHGGIGRDRKFVPKRIVGVIRELDADVVALQEVESRKTGFDMLAYLAGETGYDPIAGPVLISADRLYGNALLTRHRACTVRRIDLGVGRREPRGAIDVDLTCGGVPLRILAVHLGLGPGERREQVRRLLRALTDEREDMPTVLVGDINEWLLWGRPLRWLHDHFGRTHGPATFPAWLPVLALDRIWIKPPGVPIRIRAHRSALARIASDHLPLYAQIGFDGRDIESRAA